MAIWIWATRSTWISCSNHSYSHMRSYASDRMKATNIYIVILVSVRYRDVIMSAIASQIAIVSIVFLTVCSGADPRKHQNYASLAGLCEGNPPVTGGIRLQRASNAENVSIWWRHHALITCWRANTAYLCYSNGPLIDGKYIFIHASLSSIFLRIMLQMYTTLKPLWACWIQTNPLENVQQPCALGGV